MQARHGMGEYDVFQQVYEYCTITTKKATGTNTLGEITYTSYSLHTLAYNGQVTNFTVGETVTGATSGASGVVIKDDDKGSYGTLTLRRDANSTEYQDDEYLNGSTGGSSMAQADGASESELKCSIDPLVSVPYMIDNVRNILPQGTNISYIYIGLFKSSLGINEGDLITDIDGNEYTLLNVIDYQTHKSCLMQLDTT